MGKGWTESIVITVTRLELVSVFYIDIYGRKNNEIDIDIYVRVKTLEILILVLVSTLASFKRRETWTSEGVTVVADRIMRASFILSGILTGWWCILTLIAAPPAISLQLRTGLDNNFYPRTSKWLSLIGTGLRQSPQPEGESLSSGLGSFPSSLRARSRAGRSSAASAGRNKKDSRREQRKRCRRKNGAPCHSRNWCPEIDVGNRAYLAPTVFEGKVRSMSSSRSPGSNYAVTFEVKQVYKSQAGFQPLRKNDSVRLHFRDKSDKRTGGGGGAGAGAGGTRGTGGGESGGKSSLCRNEGTNEHQQLHELRQRDDNARVVRADIKRGKVYLVFVNRVGPRNFTILGEPVIRSKKNEQAVQAVIRPDYVNARARLLTHGVPNRIREKRAAGLGEDQRDSVSLDHVAALPFHFVGSSTTEVPVREVTLTELRDSVARTRERVKLVCRTRGSPPPRVHWLKDGAPLYPRRGLRIQHKRRRSKVVIASARPEDSGRYECVAQSTSGYRASLAAQLLVVNDIKVPETTTVAWPRQEQPCPIAGDFCMNGGTCLFFETVGEPACRCAEGFTGLRCETKDVISTGSVYNRHRAPFSCKLGLSTSYYC
ncbi:Similar to vn: Protein vein (Drosophila melanogaster) [Cotesia congregata]|uniref:Similar to vn: Protein vein (Drosophila melanogaster) n=1 Tax=Cotesia congregata TaxID=51543 RepID=A0A8J2HQD6_COTCN|nr:Similar to vn: Protein vein (Drosophila melanogaster) [Cotesia congregata]